MADITVLTGETTIRIKRRLEVLPVIDDLLVFRQTEISTVTERGDGIVFGEDVPEHAWEGTIIRNGLDEYVRGNADLESTGLVVFSDALKKDIQTLGWNAVFDYNKKPSGYERIRYDVFTAFRDGDATLANLVKPDVSNFVYYDHTGYPLPFAIHMNYLNGKLDNSHYDLVKAARHLLSRDDVTVFKRGSNDHSEVAKTVEDAVDDIPFYNKNPRRNRHLTIRWSPTTEDFNRLVEHMRKRKKKIALSTDRFDTIFELDLLGLRSAGAALFARYDKSTEEPF